MNRAIIIILLFAACSKPMIRRPLAVVNERWSFTLVALAAGPDHYNTAGGFWGAREGKRFVWATLKIHNSLKTEQQFFLNGIYLSAGGKQLRPFIIDMNSVVTMRANPQPKLAPSETVTRKLIYRVPRGIFPERIVYEKSGLAIPAQQ